MKNRFISTGAGLLLALAVATAAVAQTTRAVPATSTAPAAPWATTGPSSTQASQPAVEPPGALLSAWQDKDDPKSMIRFERTRVSEFSNGFLSVKKVVQYEDGRVILSAMGHRFPLVFQVKDAKTLVFTLNGKQVTYARLDKLPAELEVKPAKLAKAVALKGDQLQAIQIDLAERYQKDKNAIQKRIKPDAFMKMTADNAAWLKKTIAEIGWLDARRFGKVSAEAAFVLANRSADIPLMLAAMPQVEADARAKLIDGENFATLYDRVKVLTGERQRYGTQITMLKPGQFAVLPLEEPRKVDEYRKQLGIGTLKDYIEKQKKQHEWKELPVMEDD